MKELLISLGCLLVVAVLIAVQFWRAKWYQDRGSSILPFQPGKLQTLFGDDKKDGFDKRPNP